MTPSSTRTLTVLIAALCAVATGPVRASAQDVGTEAQRASGEALYVRYCSQCHGDRGDGNGYATPHLSPRPRDFTTGKFKVRTTPNGALPTHQDLVDVIRRGMPYTSMPAWPGLSGQELSDLAYFVKSFSDDFANPAFVAEPVPLPSAPSATPESIELGRTLYLETGCARCHGTLGRGDGPSAPTLIDDLGYSIRAADLTQSWTFRGGSSREDIFKTMNTGFNGTPMPSFLGALTPEQLWAITDYIDSLSGSEGPDYTNVVVARLADGPIDLANGTASFESAPVARFPIIGQIMEPGRSFHPPATSITVQAIYDMDSIALLVRWHDMRADQAGVNGLSLPVPPEEEVEVTPQLPATDPAQPLDPFAEEVVPVAPPSEFSDAVAVQIPSAGRTGARKPYFIFGDAQNPVDLWFFDLARPEPRQFIGRGSEDIAPNDTGDLTGVASYDQGEWSVIFKRPLRANLGASFSPGAFMPVGFSVWDGFERERGNRRGLTLWYSLYVEPEVTPSAIGPMVRTALLVLAIELVIIGWVRWRYRSRGLGVSSEPGPEESARA